MAADILCIHVVSGFLTGSVTTVANCQSGGGYIAVSAAEYATQPTLQDIFNIPLAADLQTMWMTGFALPIICYLTAWGYGVVINWFNER